VKQEKWQALRDEDLEGLLVERWLFRGVLLVVMLASAILTTYLGMAGANSLTDMLWIAGLLGIGFAAAATAFVMRLTDNRIHRELHRRRTANA
jgi:hypothetical protein